MVNSIFGALDRAKTIKQAKEFLLEYQDWKLKAMRFSLSLQSPIMSDMPKAPVSGNSQEDKVIDQVNAQFECELRVKTINLMKSIDEDNAMYADLLKYRFIKNMSVIKVCIELADKYSNLHGYLAERTYNDYLNQALWTFAIICPRENIRVKKVRR